ncbi:phage tail sheath subtilisin-like domain-containing protein [Celerinatantimonas sp. MCCC 1A17872]|uniref:phage tail sheath subtilisin-like domain-containing protein n=1 Tax=Celerinatantimonas sp. MCCC 1A17872 TaxID=3177514 RepID=UPI0038C73561
MTQFLHGVEVIEVDSGSRSIQTVKTAVIGLVGIAPESTGATAASLQKGSAVINDGLLLTAIEAGAGGNAISLTLVAPGEANAELSITVTGQKITVNLATDGDGELSSTAAEIQAAIADNADAAALVTVEVLGTGEGIVVNDTESYLSGGSDEPFPLNTPVAVAGSQQQADQLGTSGTLYKAFDDIFDQTGALVIVVRVAEGSSDAETQANVIKGMTAWLSAQTETGYKPRILIAPEFSQYDAVAAEMQSKAARLRAVAYFDCEMTASYTDAIKRQRKYDKRCELMWPWVTVFDDDLAKNVSRPLSARAAGLRARIDADKGAWWSKSNQEIYGIVGTAQAVDWALDDPDTTANMLNENHVSTVIQQDGFRYWGNRNCSTDTNWMFEQTVRTADMINDSIQSNHLWAVDRNLTKTYFDEVAEGVNDYLRQLKAEGAIYDGKCWADKGLNSSSTVKQGLAYFDFDFEPPFPAEHIIFRSRLNGDYIEEVFD